MTAPATATKPSVSWQEAMNLIIEESARLITVEQAKVKDDTGEYSLDYESPEMAAIINKASDNLCIIGVIANEIAAVAKGMMEINAVDVHNDIIKATVKLLGEPTMNPTATAAAAGSLEEEAPAVATATKSISKIAMPDASVLPTINLLIAPTGVKFDELVNNYNAQSDELGKIRRLLTVANDKVTKFESKPVVTHGVDTVNAEELSFDVVMVKASDIFIVPDAVTGKRTGEKSFNFDVTTLVWKDKAGAIVRHPECPEVDDAYQLAPIVLLKFLTAFRDGTNTWLFGHTGTGKSTFVEQVAARLGFPVSRVNLDSSLERADLVGHIALREEKGTTVSVYEEGILPRAMQRPGFLLMDEIDAGRPDILFVVQRALEGAGLMLTEDKGRIVKAHPLFRFAATANTRGQGDEYGMYQGTKVLNASLIDRFPAFIQFDYLKKEVEMTLIGDKHPDLDKAFIEQIVVFANEIRQAFRAGEVFQTVTPRGLDMLAKVYGHFDKLLSKKGDAMKLALEMTIYDKTTQDTVQKVRELADRCFK